MPGFGDWDPNLHPRGFHGRFIKKFKLAPWLDKLLKNSTPRTFQTDSQAAQFNFNSAHAQPGGVFNELEARRVHMDWDEAVDHIRNGDIDPTTKAFQDTINSRMHPTKEGLILGRTFTPEALGLTPQQLNENDPNGIIRMTGNTITDKAPSPTHLGSDMSHGPNKITMRIAVPEGVPVAHSGLNRNDRGVFLAENQKLLVTRVYPDGRGGWYMTAVAEPSGATTGTPNDLVQGHKGAGLTEAQRAAKIGAPSSIQQPVAPPSQPAAQVERVGRSGTAVEPGQGAPTPPDVKAARRARYNQAVANEAQQVNNPAPVGAPAAAPQPVTPTPAATPPAPPNEPGVPVRTEPVHGPIGGIPTEGKSASEVAGTPAEAPTPAPAPLQEAASPASFKQSFQEAGLQSPTRGKQRAEFNDAYTKISSGKKDPADALRELDADIEHNKTLLKRGEAPNPDEMRANVDKQEALANHIADHFNLPRAHKEAPRGAPNTATSIPETKAAGFKSVKELTPEQRTGYDSLDRLGRSRYLARRRAGQEHGAALTGAKGEKAAKAATPEAAPVKAVKKAAPTSQTEKNAAATARRAETGEQKPTVSAARVQAGDVVLAKKNDKGEWAYTRLKTGATPVTVTGKESGGGAHVIHGTGPDGEKITLNPIAGQNVLTRHKEKAPRVAKAAPEKVAKAVPEAPVKAAPAKVAKAAAKVAPAAKAPSEVQTRADEAGLPKTVTALRQAAREKKIKGFSTMNKEQLQRALMGEEVGTGGKVGAIAPDKLTPHLEAASSGQAARALLEEHTVADMKALAKHNGIPLKGLTTKDKLKDAVLTHVRGVEGSGIAPGKPEKSLKEEIKGIKVPNEADRIVADVNQDDPESLRSARDQLDELAKNAEPVDAGRIRKLSDAMGMRAQVISGQEEAPPTAKKAVKAVKKAAAPKLSVHQERIRKQALADGASEEEARAAAEEAPTRAPAGTKALSKKAAAAAKAAGLPTPREEGAPGPKLTTAKKVVPPGPRPAREGLKLGEGESHQGPQGPREPTPTEKFLATPPKERVLPGVQNYAGPPVGSPEREDMLKRASQGRLGRGQVIQGPDIREVARLRAQEIAPKSVLARRETPSVEHLQGLDSREAAHAALQDATGADLKRLGKELQIPGTQSKNKQTLRNEIVETTTGRRIDSAATKGFNNFTEAGPGQAGVPAEPPAKVAKTAVKKAEAAHPDVPKPVVKATRAKVQKAVPDGSVGTKGDKPIDQAERAALFEDGWNKAKVPDVGDASMHEIRGDVSSGKITPEEGIRRMETEISMNNDDLTGLRRDLRAAEGTPEHQDIQSEISGLERKISAQEDASRFMHQHFGKERVTPNEVRAGISPEHMAFIDNLKTADMADLRTQLRESPELKHLADLPGDNGHEFFKNAVQKLIQDRYKKIGDKSTKAADREIAQEAKKTAREARQAALDANKAKRLEEFGPGSAKHLDAKSIAGADFGRNNQVVADAQAQLDQGKSPKEVAKRVREIGQRMADGNALRHGASSGNDPEVARSMKEKFDQGEVDANKVRAFADRLEAAQRPRAPRATKAEAVAENLTEAKKVTRSPAVKEQLTQAEKTVKQSGDEADALKARIIKRHADAWDGAKNTEEARTAANNMRSDLTLAEIRQWAAPQGITGRSKQEILDKAVVQRFEGPSARKAAVGNRMEQAAALKTAAERLPEGDVAHVDRVAGEQGLTRNTGAPGDIEPFDPTKHQGETGIRRGMPVKVTRPGYTGEADGRTFQAKRADVVKAPAQKGEIKAVPAETRAAVAERLTRAPGPSAPAKRGSAAKVAVAELPQNKTEEVAQNMARLQAAKALPKTTDIHSSSTTKQELMKIAETEEVTRAKPSMTKAQIIKEIESKRGAPSEPALASAPAKAAPVKKAAKAAAPNENLAKGIQLQAQGGFRDEAPVKTSRPIRDFGPGLDARLGRENGDEKLKLPNGGQDQGRIHMDSEIGQLWQDLASDPRTQNSTLNRINEIGDQLGGGQIDVPTARALIRGIKPGSAGLRDRINKSVADLDVKPSKMDVPENTPKAVRDLLDKINEIPAYHNKAPGTQGASGPTPFEKILGLVRDIGEGKEGPGGDMKLLQAVQNPHESGDGVYQARRDGAKDLFPGNQSPEIRSWFRSWRNKPENAPAAPEPAKAAPAKATKAVKKAAPAKVTQAELRSPVAKAGNAAPAAPAKAVKATGLTPGQGIPVSNRMAVQSKLGPGGDSTLNALDTATKIESKRARVPELLAKLNTELSQKGIGPNDEPRKTLNAWYQSHFG